MSVFSPEDVPRQLCPQHSGHTNVQQGDIRTAGLLEGVQHRKGGGIDGHLDAVLLMRGRINAKVLRDPLAVPGVVVTNGYFQHRPASFAVLFCIIYRRLPLRKRSAPPDPAVQRLSARRPA